METPRLEPEDKREEASGGPIPSFVQNKATARSATRFERSLLEVPTRQAPRNCVLEPWSISQTSSDCSAVRARGGDHSRLRSSDDSQCTSHHISLECLSSERSSSITLLPQPTSSSSQVIVVIIIINTPKQAQHNIEHRAAELSRFLIVASIIIRRVDASEDSSCPTPRSLRNAIAD